MSASGDAETSDNVGVGQGSDLGSGGYAYYDDEKGRQGLEPELDNKMNDSDRKPGGDKQRNSGGTPPSYDYLETEKIKLNNLFKSFHPKVQEEMLKDFEAKSRFQNYLNDLVDIFKNMN